MQIKKSVAVALMVALGFAKATGWSDEKLKDRLSKVPGHVGADEVPDEFKDTYQSLSEANGEIEVVNDQEGSEDSPKSKSKKSKKEVTPEPEEKPKSKKKVATPPPENPPPAKKKEKKAAAPAKVVERDFMGCRVGTISANVNAALTSDWQSAEEIAKNAGVSLDQALGRLYFGRDEAIIEYRRLIQFRLPEGAKKKASKKS